MKRVKVTKKNNIVVQFTPLELGYITRIVGLISHDMGKKLYPKIDWDVKHWDSPNFKIYDALVLAMEDHQEFKYEGDSNGLVEAKG